MARVTTPTHLAKLIPALRSGLRKAGIQARVEYEPIPQTRLYRVYVIARRFDALRPSERQDIVWRIAQKVLTDDEQLRISMIMTLTPKELVGVGI